jgi:hypothetical protein
MIVTLITAGKYDRGSRAYIDKSFSEGIREVRGLRFGSITRCTRSSIPARLRSNKARHVCSLETAFLILLSMFSSSRPSKNKRYDFVEPKTTWARTLLGFYDTLGNTWATPKYWYLPGNHNLFVRQSTRFWSLDDKEEVTGWPLFSNRKHNIITA